MAIQRGKRLLTLAVCIAFAGSVAVVAMIQMREPGEAAPPSNPSSEVGTGAIDSDEGRRVISSVERQTAHLEHRLGEFSIAPDRAGLIVPVVGLTEEEADQIAALSTESITVTARDARLSAGELDQLAQHLVEELDPEDGYVRLDTHREVIEVVTPEGGRPPFAADLERSAATKLQQILDAREGPAATPGQEVDVDDLIEYHAGTTWP